MSVAVDARSASPRWLFGPVSDLMLGCGVGYGLVFAALLVLGVRDQSILVWIPLISLFTGTPHYGATLLRVYEQRSERRAYAVFAVWITAAVWAVFYLGLYDAFVGSLLLTVYLSWSPWHYSGQNYGIALMFLRRRGVEVAPGTKRALYSSFVLSFLLTLLAIHGVQPGAEYAPVQPYRGGVFHLLRLGITAPWWEVAFLGVGACYLAATGTAAVSLLRRAPARDLLPTFTLVATQALWFSLPPLLRHWELLGDDLQSGAAYAFFWVATGHTVQYVWITTYYAARDGGYRERGRYLLKALCAGSFIWSVPALIYTWSVEGTALGGVAIGPDVGVLIAAAVNIHHFILDGAIWKLRDGRVASILIRRDRVSTQPIGPPPRRWLAGAVYTAGALATLAVLAAIGEREWRLNAALASGDLAGVHASLERLRWIGHVGPDDYRRAGRVAMQQQSHREARHYFELSLQRHESAATWVAVGQLASAQGNAEDALRAYESALEVNPNAPDALFLLGSEWLRQGEPGRALPFLERAAAVVPEDPKVAASLERARKRLADEAPSGAAAREPPDVAGEEL
jgi:hypothetical protein